MMQDKYKAYVDMYYLPATSLFTPFLILYMHSIMHFVYLRVAS